MQRGLAAFWAVAKRLGRHGLVSIELMAAVFTTIRISGQNSSVNTGRQPTRAYQTTAGAKVRALAYRKEILLGIPSDNRVVRVKMIRARHAAPTIRGRA